MATGIKNGNKESPTELSGDVLKIVVIGEPRVGKTTFIRECVRDNFPGEVTSINGVRIFPCEFDINGEPRTIAVCEIDGHPDFLLEQRTPHYERADVFVFMYAIDDPSSLEMLSTKWIPETSAIINANVLPVALVGNKLDLRNNQQVIERLALTNQVPVTSEQTVGLFGPDVESLIKKELSSRDSDAVLDAFTDICEIIFGYSTL